MLLTSSTSFLKLTPTLALKGKVHYLEPLNLKVTDDIHRFFARWTGRRHSKVFKVNDGFEEISSTSEKLSKNSKNLDPIKHDNTNKEQKNHIFPQNKTVHSVSGIDFVTLKDEDTTFSKIVTEVRNRKLRKKNNLIMLEGKRLNQDALLANLVPKKIFFNDKSFLTELNIPGDMKVPFFKVSYKVIKLWSQLDTPPGIIGFYQMPRISDIKLKETLPMRVLCDNVRDPGNLGSILRVAAGAGCSELILMKGCTDPWDSKVLRAASGAHFHLPIRQDVSWSEEAKFIKPQDSVFVADSQVNRILNQSLQLPQCLYQNVDYTGRSSIVLIIGGETEGVSEDALTLTAKRGGSRLHIPLANFVESLNTGCALSVILFEMKRQFLLSENSNSQQQIVTQQ